MIASLGIGSVNPNCRMICRAMLNIVAIYWSSKSGGDQRSNDLPTVMPI